MKRATIFVLIETSDVASAIYSAYQKYIPKEFSDYRYEGGFQTLELPMEPDSPELHALLAYSDEHRLHYRLFSTTKYSPAELNTIPYFQLSPSYPLELEGTHARDYGTQYVDRCPECDFSTTRSGELLVDRKFVRKTKIGNIVPEYIVSEYVKQIIEDNGLTGITFPAMVKDYKYRDIPPIYVAEIDNVLPPVSKSTWLSVYHHRPCGHDTVYLESDLQYEAYKLAEAKDFNLTTEYINNYQIRMLVVSSKVKKLLTKTRIRVQYKPVFIIKD